MSLVRFALLHLLTMMTLWLILLHVHHHQ